MERNNSHTPSTAQVAFCFPPEPNIPEGTESEKYQHYIDARREVLLTPHRNNDSCRGAMGLSAVCDCGIS